MCNDRVAAVYDLAVVAALVEHTHIQTEHVSQIYGTVGTTFIRADNHHMFGIDL